MSTRSPTLCSLLRAHFAIALFEGKMSVDRLFLTQNSPQITNKASHSPRHCVQLGNPAGDKLEVNTILPRLILINNFC